MVLNNFYKNLSTGQNKSEALRNAKLAYINNTPDYRRHPYYWAGLVLVGDDGPINIGVNNEGRWLFALMTVFVIVFLLTWQIKKST